MVRPIVEGRYLAQLLLVVRENDVAVPRSEVLENLLFDRWASLDHALARGHAVLPVDDVELPRPKLVLVRLRNLNSCGRGHNAEGLKVGFVCLLHQVVDHLVHALLLNGADCPIFWCLDQLIHR